MTDEETNINLLFGLALDRIAFLPFSYMIDKFRWDVYSGLASKEDMNCHWLVLVPIIITVLPPQVEAASLHPGPAAPHHPHQGPVRCRGQVSRGRRHRLRPLLHRLNLQVPVLPLDVS